LLAYTKFNEELGSVVQRLTWEVKKYGLFWKLFFVDGQGFNPDLAICNKRFVTDFFGGVLERI
jgi:hypothetical protein